MNGGTKIGGTLVVAMAGLFGAHAAEPPAQTAPAASSSPAVAEPDELAAGVYLIQGQRGPASAGNLGRIGNAGFIVGRLGVLAIDSGSSYAHGRALLEAIRGVTDRPIRLLILTSDRPEFALGAAAFREAGIPVAMQRAAADRLAKNGEASLAAWREALGEAALRGTTLAPPDRPFTDPLTMDAAALIGRPIQLLHFDHSSGPGDIAVFDPRTATLFAGALVDVRRVPDLSGSNVAGWKDALQTLRALPIELVIPGHGRPGSLRSVGEEQRYLDALTARVASLRGEGVVAEQLAARAALPDFAAWDGYEPMNGRNARWLYERPPASAKPQ